MVALGLEQQGVHIRMTGNAGRLGLHCLGPSDLQPFRSSKRVEGHILGLEGGGGVSVLQEDAAQGCGEDTLAHVAAGSGKHHGMEPLCHRLFL